VEDGREGPCCQPRPGEAGVEAPERVRGRDVRPHLAQAPLVCPQVEQREQHREGLLRPQRPVERPLAVELHRRLPARLALVGDDVLACVIALGRARPEEESAVEG